MTSHLLAFIVLAAAQTPAPPPERRVETPLRVQLTISTFEGEKKISSVPYTLSVTAVTGSQPKLSQLRMGTKIPLPSTKPVTVDGKPIAEAMPGLPTGGAPVTYREIGTNIDCSAWVGEGGRYELQITVEDSSIPREDAARAAKTQEPPMIRSFRLSNRVILRDGQSTQFTAATDRITGETVRIDVTVSVAK
jgi:hypothetical protein